MSRNRGKDTGPEMVLRRALWAKGLRYRVHYKLPGKPDIVFPGRKLAIFVDGCFWHGCPVHGTKPRTRKEFWRNKISENKQRDKRVVEELKDSGWRVLRFWEHEIKDGLGAVLDEICKGVQNQ